jgi:DNA-binding CsgD family transcriptional regulator/tetratricopeptide (TPR) repeat protein
MAQSFREHFLDDEQLPRLRELRREHPNVRAALEYALGDADDEVALADQACCPGLVVPAAEAGRDDGRAAPPDQDGHAAKAEPSAAAGPADQARGVADGVELATALAPYWRAGCRVPEGTIWLSRAIERAPAGSAARGGALLARGHLLTTLGQAEAALADADEALALASQLSRPGGQSAAVELLTGHAQLIRNGALCASGRLAEAADAGAAARRLLTAADDRLGLISLDAQLAYLALLSEDIEAALGHVERALRLLGNSRERWSHASLYLLASLALYLAGRDIESTWTVTRALQVKQELGDTVGTAWALELLGWLAARSGSHQRAAWLLGGAEPHWQRAGGRLAATPRFERLHAEAVTRSTDALGASQLAELRTRGARHPLDAVVAFALNQAGSPADDDAVKARLPVQLTTREQEIAALVADGLSNRQIAEHLVISRRTVDAHLEHIFAKLGITSRVMLTIQLREYAADPATDANANADYKR